MLQINICGKGIDVSTAMKERVETGLADALTVMDIDVTSANVVLKVNPQHDVDKKCKCEIKLGVPKTKIRVSEADADMYKAIDAACAKIARQIRRYKTRVITNARRKSRKTDIPTHIDIHNIDGAEAIKRDKSVELTRMTIDEALCQMDVFDYDFFLFIDANTDLPSVVYLRDDNAYGVIRGVETA